MKVTVFVANSFKKAAKPLLKKYPSLKNDLQQLEKTLTNNPKTGTPIGYDSYKIRLRIASKGKGKSGGARVISFLQTSVFGHVYTTEEEVIVNLITIYDKSEVGSITNSELKQLIKELRADKK